ncbi:hypothetical protein BU16DRAFT_585187 [Lophium mytilinum]|uniref:Uncharacterized protein n=1 Tax=Lophium mytilinum TaxID=390894 RepID=A0A6A6QF73_9PEZI|nr:hypothetical protein BU16DRAFT_585187 [Lophium mytilinum]
MSSAPSRQRPPQYSRLTALKGGSNVDGVVEAALPQDHDSFIQRARSQTDQLSSNLRNRRHWGTPTLMVGSFCAGIVFAVGHHVYYKSLDNTVVGSAARQQWPIRFGTAFAFFVKTCLTTATGTAYVQWAWRRCRQKAVTIDAINRAFAVDKNIFLFLNLNFLSEFPIAVVVAILLWCMPLSALVTPATLGVAPKPNTTLHNLLVNRPSISNFDPDTNEIYDPDVGQSAQLSRVFANLASTGELLHLSPPTGLQNASYALDLIIPIVRCQPSSETVRAWTAAAAFEAATSDPENSLGDRPLVPYAQNLTYTISANASAKESPSTLLGGQIGYFGMLGNTTITPYQGVTGDVWIAIAEPSNGTRPDDLFDGSARYDASYHTCSLRNASVPTNVTFVNNVQSIQTGTVLELELNQSNQTDVEGNASAPMYGLDNYAVFADLLYTFVEGIVLISIDGDSSIGWVWNTTLDQTILGTAADFSAMTALWRRGGAELGETPQNRTLTSLIEEFSLNASLSLMSMSVLSDKTMAQVNETIFLNKYTYDPEILFIAYGCSILASLFTILAGVYAIHANGESYNMYFSSISKAVQNPDIAALFAPRSSDAPALEKEITKTKIRLVRDGEDEKFRLHRNEDSESVTYLNREDSSRSGISVGNEDIELRERPCRSLK